MTTDSGRASWPTRLGNAITRTRVWTSNLVFLLVVGFVLMVWVSSCQGIRVPDGSALILNPTGVVVEQVSFDTPLTELIQGDVTLRETAIGDLRLAVERATADERIKAIVLELDELNWISTAHAQTLGSALTAFREAGKSVLAYGNFFEQPQYLLASYADGVYLHPDGQAVLRGIGIYQLYFKDLLDKLKVDVNIYKVGTYKDFVEPYQRSDMSEAAREANSTLTAALWDDYRQQVSRNRDLPADTLDNYVNRFPEQLDAAGGHLARAALEAGLVDELLNHDQVRIRIGDQVGYDDNGDYRGVDYRQYLGATGPASGPGGRRHVSVIVAQGGIVLGQQDQGVASAPELAALIRQARADDANVGLVVRVDSPGGSSFASELIRQELEVYQMTGRPLVISMGNAAASGGYWISATADHIVAEPTTITGSIGVFGLLPTFEKTLAEIGVRTDGVGTGPLTGTGHPLLGVNEQFNAVLQQSVEHTYEQFINIVARGRDMSPEAVDAIAQGRVWTGRQALANGLVDSLGSLDEAIAKAMELAGLEQRAVKFIRPALSPRDLLLRQLFGSSAATPEARLLARVQRLLDPLNWLDDPAQRYALCLSCATPANRWQLTGRLQ